MLPSYSLLNERRQSFSRQKLGKYDAKNMRQLMCDRWKCKRIGRHVEWNFFLSVKLESREPFMMSSLFGLEMNW